MDLITIYNAIETLIMFLIALHSLAVFVVNMTPTPKDDAFVARFYRVVEIIAGIISSKAKQ